MRDAKEQLLYLAGMLKSEDGENPEYDRGMCELIADFIGLPLGDGGALEVAKKIGCENTDVWYQVKRRTDEELRLIERYAAASVECMDVGDLCEYAVDRMIEHLKQQPMSIILEEIEEYQDHLLEESK